MKENVDEAKRVGVFRLYSVVMQSIVEGICVNIIIIKFCIIIIWAITIAQV